MITQAEFELIPSDLKVRLSTFSKPQLAGRFFQHIGKLFTIYSSSVGKVYTDYKSELVGTKSDNQILVVNPNFQKFDSIFSFIDNGAVTKTDLKIILVDKDGIKQVLLVGPSAIDGKTICFELKKGLIALMQGKFKGGFFLPVLRLGELSELPSVKLPVISIHKIDPKALKSRSEFEIKDLSNSILENINHSEG
ncbi:MAG: hypothetical protein HRU38_16065 [Saccharospirillaceae bacterium]|nr:hypothetical protein [Pseudomonadales bacterium]NRB80158.1 hypothetical protein [Saccharospirillaceae bacterium]